MLSRSNLPVRFWGKEIRWDGDEVSPEELLSRIQQELNAKIDEIRQKGSPINTVEDVMMLTEVLLEKDLDRADHLILYLLARPECNFSLHIYETLRDISFGIFYNQLTSDDLFNAYLRAAFPIDWLEQLQTTKNSCPDHGTSVKREVD
jgi:hypothetical protein